MSTRSRRKFTPEFKAEAVAMVQAAGGMALTAIDTYGGVAAAMARGQGPRLVRDRQPETYRALRGDRAAAVDG